MLEYDATLTLQHNSSCRLNYPADSPSIYIDQLWPEIGLKPKFNLERLQFTVECHRIWQVV